MFVLIALFAVACGGGSSSSSEGGTSVIPLCGNGTIDGTEVCDGNVPCWKAGHFYPQGEAVCNSNCTGYDTSKCLERDAGDLCGNFQIDSGESCEQGDTKPCKELSDTFAGGDAECRSDCRGWDPANCTNGGTKTCAQIISCIKACAGDANCENDCKESGTEQGKETYAALESCSAACNGITDDKCLSTNCYEAYYACYPKEKCGNGTIDDGEICENKETKPCQELNTADKTWQPINDAVCNSTCDGWDTYACVDINDLTCYQTYECAKDCSDSECEHACIEKAFTEAKAKYNAMKECLAENCPVETDECINEFCKFQMDTCKTHLTCGNGIVDQDMGELCEKNEFKDCGEITDANGETYEAGTGSAFCSSTCTEYSTRSCHKFCSCAEIQTCIEETCGGYPTSNAENTAEKKKCMEACEDQGSQVGATEASGYRELVEMCYEENGPEAWDSDGCKNQFPSQQGWSCSSGNDPKCPY